jgi:hypothetical protein
MSNRYMNQFPLAFEKQVKSVFAKVEFNTTGDPVLSGVDSKGVLAIARNGVGEFSFQFGSAEPTILDSYVKLLGINVVFNSGGSAPAAPVAYVIQDDSADSSIAEIEIGTLSLAGSAADPVSGEIGYFQFIFGDSTAP